MEEVGNTIRDPVFRFRVVGAYIRRQSLNRFMYIAKL